MRNTTINIGKIHRAIPASKIGTHAVEKPRSELPVVLSKPYSPKPLSVKRKGVTNGKFMTRIIITRNDCAVQIDGRVVPHFLTMVFLSDKFSFIVIFESAICPITRHQCFTFSFIIKAA